MVGAASFSVVHGRVPHSLSRIVRTTRWIRSHGCGKFRVASFGRADLA
jgi:hypothetical protein